MIERKSFIKQNRAEWEQLEQRMREMRQSRKLIPEQVELFQQSYQRTAYLLSFSQTYYPQDELTAYLNDLVSRAHHLLYRGQVTSWLQIKDFFNRVFVGLLWEQRGFVGCAAFLFILGALGGFASVMMEPLNIYTILPVDLARGIDPGSLGGAAAEFNSPLISAQIMTNNIQVAFYAFLGGITLGLFTIYLLIENGLLLGALAAIYYQYGNAYDFWAFIIPHGVIELTAIFIAGGAGLLMGYRIVVPGPYPRLQMLKHQALRSVQLLLGTLPLFVIAGLIEGYITPAPIALELKYLVAIITALGLFLYVFIKRPVQ
ncbi:MAG: stage II sporulation protein M [Peptococcaceae bacterium]|jgi:uncharacterized membrane protein SpoIIM required for sporulation|nr:stage II sporulation protein M [Peptococcaceae bacterium]